MIFTNSYSEESRKRHGLGNTMQRAKKSRRKVVEITKE